jgi:alpha-1,6-mannosyltransferase
MVFLDVNSFLSPRGGGARTYHIQKAEWFSRQAEHRYLVVGPGAGVGAERLGDTEFLMRTGWGLPYGRSRNYRVLLDYSEADRLIDREGVEVLETGDPWISARWSMRRPGVLRTCMWHSDPHTAYLAPWAGRNPVRKLLARIVLSRVDTWHRHFDRIWCASEWIADLLRGRGYPNVERIRFGVDHERFRPGPRAPELLTRLGLDPDRPVVLYAGRLDFEKGVSTLQAAIPGILGLPERPQVLVTGRGEWEEKFRETRLEGFAYGGFLDRDALSDLLRSSTLLLATCAVETFGLGVLESLCSGLPVVSADGGGGGEQVRHSGAGELFAPDDPVAAVDAVRRALPRVAELSHRARDWGNRWPSWDEMFQSQADACAELWRSRA